MIIITYNFITFLILVFGYKARFMRSLKHDIKIQETVICATCNVPLVPRPCSSDPPPQILPPSLLKMMENLLSKSCEDRAKRGNS